MMDDWHVGDMALCLETDCGLHGEQRKKFQLRLTQPGMVYTVKRVIPANPMWTLNCGCGLMFVEVNDPHPTGYCGKAFKKTRPSAIQHIEALKSIPVPIREREDV